MASLRALVTYASNFVSQLPLSLLNANLHNVSPYEPLSAAPSCPLDGPISCQNSTPVSGDSCCFVHPAGRILLGQVWDEQIHAAGAEEDWTLRGLWCVSFSPWPYPGRQTKSPSSAGSPATTTKPPATANPRDDNRPDHCDGTASTYCSSTPQYTNITSILRHYGQTDLLEFMHRYWLAASCVVPRLPSPKFPLA